MIDWNPLVAAAAVFVMAISAALPSIVVIIQHNATRGAIAANSETLTKIEQNTDGTLEDMNAAIRSLRAEVVRLSGLADGQESKGKQP